MEPAYPIGHAGSVDLATLLRVRVDREQELETIRTGLCERGDNVLITGERGTGKSFLQNSSRGEVLRQYRGILCVRMDVSNLLNFSGPLGLGRIDAVDFARKVLIQTCVTVWDDVLGRRFIELRASLETEGKARRAAGGNAIARAILELYRYLMLSESTSSRSTGSSIKLGASGTGVSGAREASTTERVPPLLPHEFPAIAAHLASEVLGPLDLHRAIIFCDEANILPTHLQTELLSTNLAMFNANTVSFCFSAGVPMLESSRVLGIPMNYFDTHVALGGFSNSSDSERLLETYYPSCDWTEAASVMHERLLGQPRHLLGVARDLSDTPTAEEAERAAARWVTQLLHYYIGMGRLDAPDAARRTMTWLQRRWPSGLPSEVESALAEVGLAGAPAFGDSNSAQRSLFNPLFDPGAGNAS